MNEVRKGVRVRLQIILLAESRIGIIGSGKTNEGRKPREIGVSSQGPLENPWDILVIRSRICQRVVVEVVPDD